MPRLEEAGGPSAAARTDLGSCHLGKFLWKVPHLGKILLESTDHLPTVKDNKGIESVTQSQIFSAQYLTLQPDGVDISN